MEKSNDVIVQPPKTRGVPENDLILRASELVDVALEFRRRLEFARGHIAKLWSILSEIERVAQESSTLDPFTKATLLRLISARSHTGIVGDKDRALIIPDGGPAGDPTR